MAINSELVTNIKTYLELDKEIEALNTKTAELRKKRSFYEEKLISEICKKKWITKCLL